MKVTKEEGFSGKTGRGVRKWELEEEEANQGGGARPCPREGSSGPFSGSSGNNKCPFKVILTKSQEAEVAVHPHHTG